MAMRMKTTEVPGKEELGQLEKHKEGLFCQNVIMANRGKTGMMGRGEQK